MYKAVMMWWQLSTSCRAKSERIPNGFGDYHHFVVHVHQKLLAVILLKKKGIKLCVEMYKAIMIWWPIPTSSRATRARSSLCRT